MAYETYTTEALVCGTKDRNTADRSFLLFTREAGMLFADARSVRTEQSRQRYALQDFSLLRVSLVKGKRGWRIGSIEPQQNFYQQAADKAARGSVVKVIRLLRRFLHGEEADAQLFDRVVSALEVLAAEVEHRSFVELTVFVHTLARLGYVDGRQLPASLIECSPVNICALYDAKTEEELGRLYTHALSVSHL